MTTERAGLRRFHDRTWRWVIAAWLMAEVMLGACWFWFRNPAVLSTTPGLFFRFAALFGTVVFSDPALAVRIQITRCGLLVTAIAMAAMAYLERDRLRRSIDSLIHLKSDPLNLAIFRIVVFWQIYNICYVDLITRIASLPAGLQYPPQTGLPRIGVLAAWAFWPQHLVDAGTIHLGVTVMKWAAVAGAIGFFSRSSAALVSILFLLAWGRLQWYGKVDHVHHLVWFALILMLSPSGDALSFDSVRAAIKRARDGVTSPPLPGQRYGTPLALCMLLVGVLYFFPGLWKISRSGLDWVFSDSPKFMMQTEWKLYGDWLPLFRFDQYPALYHSGALFTLLFELTFIFLLLFRRTRWWAPLLGFGFHWMTYFTLNIEFETLRNCYVLFVDWAGLFRWIGQKLFPSKLTFFYPPSTAARRAIAVLRRFDFFGRIEYVEHEPSLKGAAVPINGLIDDRPVEGLTLYRLAASRLLLLWPALPILYVLPAGPPPSRIDIVAAKATVPEIARQPRWTQGPGPALVMGCVLLAANICAGAVRAMDGWPVACYPPFDGLSAPAYRTLQIWVTLKDGQQHLIVPDDYRKTFGNRWSNLLQRILNTKDERDRSRRLKLVWQVLASQDPALGETTSVRFVSVRTFVDPARGDQASDDPEVLLETRVELPGKQ